MIKIHNLSKKYAEVEAIKSINLQVKPNELFGLIGPDGAGKTTLFRILTTLLIADSGNAALDGLDVVADYKKIRELIGYMPGRFSLYQDLSVEENLSFFATVFGTTIEENYDLIADIYKQIEPFKKRLAGKLSGGMKQKLALSCALIHKPKILLLDEPTTGVDAVSRMEFWQMLKKLQQKGITILVSTPYMDEASLCDRVALIQNGQILTVDTPNGISKSFSKPLFAVNASNKYQLINDLRNYDLAATVYPFGEFVHVTLKIKNPDTEPLKSYLISKGNKEIQVGAIEATIEDCFMELMKNGERRMNIEC
ncbi:MAG TPA: ATPase [Marinilabiliales bacterium]|jgi:ABC-type multidrug transport system ATPase subunit|nr:MAG: ATPase [Bacteroidetes bacterium GWA2_40_14]OFX59895.1 MAG: ATPase [Bacteroidetes bacterium GWC2_40_13]OFX75118.1 MAG: ATPase [Bacteroidetes bacterium GWD2_40_43]OFX93833.1 MAG: ATPase [Bacteroidetes bacterium GWE2_40_63]OFY18094.1 MAG: ATPase [Bacteroidetes bacterium GWF2_40_13]OFZ27295.1 MAG: ATPase [Bacteroidetes bacterium RIFOXYC2_FULL_40_12]HAM99004.1 ATPase [Marinilabiliales bacterium]